MFGIIMVGIQIPNVISFQAWFRCSTRKIIDCKNVIRWKNNRIFTLKSILLNFLQPLLSKLTFSWMFPLLKLGYSTPLEMEDLQTAPPTESSKKQFQNLFKFIGTSPAAIFFPCIRQNWILITAAGLSRLFSDISSLSGAVCIKFIVESLSEDISTFNQTSYRTDASNETTFDSYEISWNDFSSNSHVISVVILLSGVFQAIFSQSSSHLLTVAGTRSMSALQVIFVVKLKYSWYPKSDPSKFETLQNLDI